MGTSLFNATKGELATSGETLQIHPPRTKHKTQKKLFFKKRSTLVFLFHEGTGGSKDNIENEDKKKNWDKDKYNKKNNQSGPSLLKR
jgi:hypothetical protein